MISGRSKSDRMAYRDAYRDKYVSWMGGIFFAVLGTCFALKHMGQEKWLAPFDIPIRAILVFTLAATPLRLWWLWLKKFRAWFKEFRARRWSVQNCVRMQR
jgi:hypothetical protein